MVGPVTAFQKSSSRIPPIDYTSRDFESISQDQTRAIPFFTPEWTDQNLSDFGIVLQRLQAFVADVLHFYIDRMANEAFLPTAITRQSVINLLKLIDFRVPSAVPASVDLVFTLQSALLSPLTIPAGTQVQTAADDTGSPVIFETVSDLVIPAGQLSGTVSAVQGQTETETVGVSSGLPNQQFTLANKPIIDGTLEVFVDEGAGPVLWTQVDTFITSGPTDKNFTSQTDAGDVTTIFFGDNVQGKVPNPGATVTATERIGGGAFGNVGAHTITSINSTITQGGNPVPLTVDNPNSASGGQDEMSIEDAKVLGPLSLQSLNRAVTEQDFINLAELFPGVAKASVTVGGSIVQPGIGCCCQLTLVISPQGGGVPSMALRQGLLDYFDSRKMIGTCLQIADPVYQPIRVTGTAFIAANFATEAAAVDINTVIQQYFALDGNFSGFGENANLSNIMRLLDQVPGMDHIDLSEFTLQPVPQYQVWHSPSCTFSDIQVGARVKVEDWTVIFTSATEFTVRGSVSGLQAATGVLGAPYTSDDGSVSFSITCSGPDQPQMGDRAVFSTSTKVGDVPMLPNQIMAQGEVNISIVGGSRTQKECFNP